MATPELALICMHIWLMEEYWNSAKSGLKSLLEPKPAATAATDSRGGRGGHGRIAGTRKPEKVVLSQKSVKCI